MDRLGLKLVVFLSGVLLAIGLPFGIGLLSSLASVTSAKVQTSQVSTWNFHEQSNNTSNKSNSVRVINGPLDGLSNTEITEQLRRAAVYGSLESLQLLRQDYLKGFPEYHTLFLPLLKEESLSALLSRFSDNDWSDWPRASFALNGNPSQARSYIDDINLVNKDLGRFLETSAYLLHGLYVKTMSGNLYNIKENLHFLLRHAERMHARTKMKALPAYESFDPNIANEPAFMKTYHMTLADLVVSYIKSHPVELENQLSLILSTNPKYSTPEILQAITVLLRRFSLDVSPKYRANIIWKIGESSVIDEYAKKNEKVRRSLAELFLIAALDAIESQDRKRALLYVSESISVYPDLRTQQLLLKSLRGETDKLVNSAGGRIKQAETTPPLKKTTKHDLFSNDVQSFSISIWPIILLSFILFFALVIYIRYRRAVTMANVEIANHPKERKFKMTSPSDVDFNHDSRLANE